MKKTQETTNLMKNIKNITKDNQKRITLSREPQPCYRNV